MTQSKRTLNFLIEEEYAIKFDQIVEKLDTTKVDTLRLLIDFYIQHTKDIEEK